MTALKAATTSAARAPVTLVLAATGGGVQRHRVTLANALVGRGYEVDLVLPQARGPYLQSLDPAVAVHDLGSRRPIALIPRLARYLRQARPCAIVVSQQHMIIAAVWARWLARSRAPLIVTQHNTLSELCRQSRRPAVRLLLPTLAQLFFPRADTLTAVSRGVALDLGAVTGVPVDRIEVIYNPIVPADLTAKVALASGHPWLDQKRCPVVLGAGNLIPLKDFATLVRAFAHVRQQRAARLVILGDGEERPALERLARELGISADVDFPGFQANPYAFMARADVFAMTSRVEGFPSVLVEAMACGCPVVSTDCPSGPAELLENGRYGTLIPVGDDAALGRAIDATLRAPPDKALLRAVGSSFSIERALDRYVAILRAHGRDPSPGRDRRHPMLRSWHEAGDERMSASPRDQAATSVGAPTGPLFAQ
jgi:glycosyltransferase involved in cell wall biosynthesis